MGRNSCPGRAITTAWVENTSRHETVRRYLDDRAQRGGDDTDPLFDPDREQELSVTRRCRQSSQRRDRGGVVRRHDV
jgi:hypothetical protein